MSEYYLDSSALVKRYADEAGSEWVRQITKPCVESTILLAEISLAEVAAALAAKSRASNGITLEERDRALSLFLQECQNYFILLAIDRDVIDWAVELVQEYRLRGYDAVQLATAVVNRQVLREESLPAPLFVSSDYDLLVAAETEGFMVENPLHHITTVGLSGPEKEDNITAT